MARPWWRSLWPAALAIDGRERLRVVVGATLGVLLTALLSQWLGGPAAPDWPWLAAPMGATALLVFAVPASPMAQPWAVVAGNTLSALVGVACARWIGPPALAAALALGGAIALMIALRCLHPPGGACALLPVLTGLGDPRFALFPVLANSLLLVLAGWAYHRATRRAPAAAPAVAPADAAVDVDADLDAVLARYNQVLDISRDDLKALLEDTQLLAYQRVLANIRCRDIMSRDLVAVSHTTPLSDAWALYRQHRIKALPVVDAAGAIVGIVTPADFIRAAGLDGEDPFGEARRASRDAGTPVPERIGQIMTRQVRVAGAERRLLELIPLFGSTGHHHIPIVEAGGRVVGIVTQSDVVAAMCAAGEAPPPRT